jgi:hypothetical protein
MEQRKTFSQLLEYDLGVIGNSCKKYTAHARDISAHGVQIVTDYPLKRGMVLRLGLPVSGAEISVPVFAEVAWALPTDNGFRAGLQYLK